MDFRDRLIKLIKTKKLSQANFASQIGVSPGNVSNWLNPNIKSKPTFDAMVQICERFNVNINWLLTGQGTMFTGVDKENPEQERKLEEMEAEVRLLRIQIAALEKENKEIDIELKQRLRELLGLQGEIIKLKC